MEEKDFRDCFLDLQIGSDDKNIGKLKISLNWEIVPKTCLNFKCLCTGEKGKGVRAKQLHYKNSKINRVIPNFMAQGGDIINSNGTGQESIYGFKFKDENLKQKHDKKYLLGMVNNGTDSNGCQFYITFVPCPWLDGKNVIFGEVVKGQEFLEEVEKQGSQDGIPDKEITIVDCGIL